WTSWTPTRVTYFPYTTLFRSTTGHLQCASFFLGEPAAHAVRLGESVDAAAGADRACAADGLGERLVRARLVEEEVAAHPPAESGLPVDLRPRRPLAWSTGRCRSCELSGLHDVPSSLIGFLGTCRECEHPPHVVCDGRGVSHTLCSSC